MDGGRLEFDVLGALEVHRGRSPIAVASTRQRTLLAALLVEGSGPVPADGLIEAVWGEALPADPRAALNTLLSRLRGVLGHEAIESGPAGYRLVHDPEAVDAVRFEASRRRSQQLSTMEAIEALDEALALWRGPAYAEFADLDFATAEAGRLDQLRISCIEERAELHLGIGDDESAVAALEGHVIEHPLSERALALLMTGLYRLGRQGEALERFGGYRHMLVQEMGLDPSPALMDLELAILNHDLAWEREGKTAAPASWTTGDDPIVGREEDVAVLTDLAANHRLVTVTGMAGVGKTRLVAESVATIAEDLGLPLTVVELSGTDADHVDVTIASALGIGPIPRDVEGATLDYLSVTPMLLVLDSCEHVTAPVSRFLHAAFGRCPSLRVLTTSRRPTGLRTEQILPLDPIPTPGPGDSAVVAEGTAAMCLLVSRARQARPTFTLELRDVQAAASICRRLDGLPLAIELAAARAAVLGVGAVAARLEQSLDLFEMGAGGGRSLRAALEWSFELLDEPEQHLLMASSVFEGSFDLEAVEAVAPALLDGSVAAHLAGLVDSSLVTTRAGGDGVRYQLLEVVRQFAHERLKASGQEDAARGAHARWVQSLMRRAATTALGADDASVPEMLDVRAGDIRAAVSWAVRTGDLELAGDTTGHLVLAAANWQLSVELIDLARRVAEAPELQAAATAPLAEAGGGFVAALRGDLEAGEKSARDALARARGVEARYLALLTLGIVTLYSGRRDESRRWWGELLAIEGLAPAHLFDGHASLALIANYAGDHHEARGHLARAWAAVRASGSRAQRCFVRYVEAELAVSQDLEAAVPLLEAAVRESDRVRADFRGGLASTALAAAHTRLGRTSEAAPVFTYLLDLWLRLAAWPQMWTTLRLLSELLSATRRPESAALLLLAAGRAADAPAVAGDDRARYAALEKELRTEVGSDAWGEASTLATMLPRAQVVERALAAVEDLQPV